jgi:hypothetical protein
MIDLLVPLSALLVLCVPVFVFAWQYRKVWRGHRSRLKATLFYAIFSAVPVLLYVGVFLVLVGVEELTDTALIGEAYARSLVIVAVGGLGVMAIGSLLFAIVAALTRPRPG